MAIRKRRSGGIKTKEDLEKMHAKLWSPSEKKRRMTKEQREWCKHYENHTTFEPLMDDFLHGNETFVQAAKKSIRWFEDWSSDMFLNITRQPIPGEDE
jgi:hypothetical protein